MDDAEAQAQAVALIGAIEANWIVNYASVACSAMLVADYLQTLPDEIKHMWPAKMSLVKILFFLSRYYPFAHTVINIWDHGDLSRTGADCVPQFTIIGFLSVMVSWICGVIGFLRVYAFSGRNKNLLFFLVPWYLLLHITELVLVYKFTRTPIFIELPLEARLGCVVISAQTLLLSMIFVANLLSFGGVTAIMIFIAWRRWYSESEVRVKDATGLFRIFLQDGIMYFVCLFSLAIVNIIFDHAAPQNGLQYIMVQLQVHADVILTARMLISLRAMGNQDVVETGNSLAIRMYARSYLRDPVTSELHFRSQGCQLTSDNGSLSQPYEPITLDHALDIRR